MSTDLEALVAEASNPTTSFGRLVELQCYSKEEVRRSLLNNPNLCPIQKNGRINVYVMEKLVEDFPEEVAGHPAFVLHALIEPNQWMKVVVIEVVKRTVNVGLIEHVWRTWGPSEWGIRQAVAKNPSTPAEILRSLGKSQSEPLPDVRYWANRNLENRGLA